MKKLFFLATAVWLGSTVATAQNLVPGAKIPDFKLKRWLTDTPPEEEKRAVVIEFFYSTNPISVDRLRLLDEWAGKYADRLRVIVLTKEESPEALAVLLTKDCRYYAGLDDNGKTFAAYGVQYVPYGVVADPKGRILWSGNSAHLKEENLLKLLEHDVYKEKPLRKSPPGGTR